MRVAIAERFRLIEASFDHMAPCLPKDTACSSNAIRKELGLRGPKPGIPSDDLPPQGVQTRHHTLRQAGA
jgi:hypothetical protein